MGLENHKTLRILSRLSKYMIIATTLIISGLMAVSYVSLFINNSDMQISEPDITFDETGFYANITIPFSLDNTGLFDLQSSSIELTLSNGTQTEELDIIRIPAIPAKTKYDGNISFSLSFDSLEELQAFEDFAESVNYIDLKVNVGLFWSSLYLRGYYQMA